MPLKRTPPNSPSATRLTLQIDSDSKSSDRCNSPTNSAKKLSQASRKHKRRREGSFGDDSDANVDFRDELLKLFEEFKKQQDKNFKILQDTISKQNKDIQSTLDFISSRYDDMQKKIELLESEKKKSLAIIQTLEEKVETFERRNNAACLEIRNIPTTTPENKIDLTNYIIKTGKVLNTTIQSCDIRNIYRASSKVNTIKPIVVEFTTVSMKEKLLQLSKSYNRKHCNNKLSSQTLNLDGPAKPVYISEFLTYKARKLFAQAREFGTKNNFAFCWTAHNRIYLRRKEGDPYCRIDCERDLEKLRKVR
ncbi:jg1392 [Pararge aegeria aegeria]|uniref:Jg1392 protein n=1 Tax=Pararge aegeria aegeria TaxID=348720 RepID=A0A8S4QN61_9NEOP|nr:jg1392 [Pararge aegeria aegeria]